MKTERLEIRLLKKSDYLAWKTVYSIQLPMKNRWDSKNKPLRDLTRSKYFEMLRQHKKNINADKTYVYGVFLETGQLIGSIVIGNVLRGLTHSAFLGYHLYNPYWGLGYATEMIEGTLEIAFKEQKLHRLVAGIESDNKRSLKLIRKFGFRREGVSKRVVFLRGKWQDLAQYALTCEEYGLEWFG